MKMRKFLALVVVLVLASSGAEAAVLMKTFRDFLIAIATARREEDIDYWSRKLADGLPLGEKIIVTDWRFPSEKTFLLNNIPSLKLTTVRVYREEVPRVDHFSETSLDEEETDFLLLAPKEVKEIPPSLLSICPFYQNYHPL